MNFSGERKPRTLAEGKRLFTTYGESLQIHNLDKIINTLVIVLVKGGNGLLAGKIGKVMN